MPSPRIDRCAGPRRAGRARRRHPRGCAARRPQRSAVPASVRPGTATPYPSVSRDGGSLPFLGTQALPRGQQQPALAAAGTRRPDGAGDGTPGDSSVAEGASDESDEELHHVLLILRRERGCFLASRLPWTSCAENAIQTTLTLAHREQCVHSMNSREVWVALMDPCGSPGACFAWPRGQGAGASGGRASAVRRRWGSACISVFGYGVCRRNSRSGWGRGVRLPQTLSRASGDASRRRPACR